MIQDSRVYLLFNLDFGPLSKYLLQGFFQLFFLIRRQRLHKQEAKNTEHNNGGMPTNEAMLVMIHTYISILVIQKTE